MQTVQWDYSGNWDSLKTEKITLNIFAVWKNMWFQKKRIELHVRLQLAACISSSERDRCGCRDIFRTGQKCLEEYWNNFWKWKFTLNVRFWHFLIPCKGVPVKKCYIKKPHNTPNFSFLSQKLRVGLLFWFL